MTSDETAIPRLGESQPPRDSATVIVARDAPGGGIEVFMLERALRSDFVGGAYVFPGGTVDDADCDPALHDYIEGPPPSEAAALVDAPFERALGFHLCAIRETFEEAGILLARGPDGNVVHLDGPERARFAEARRALNARETTLLEVAKGLDIRYALDLMYYFSRWITPEGLHKRYDARFFFAALPAGQTPIHDEVETTASLWVRPEAALIRAREGDLNIIFPTRKTLEELAELGNTADVIASTTGKDIRAILPRLVVHEGQPHVELPDGTKHQP